MVVTLHRSRQIYMPIALFMGLYGAKAQFVRIFPKSGGHVD